MLKRKHRRMIVGSVEQLADEAAARQAVAALCVAINRGACLRTRPSTLFELAEHDRRRELEPDTIWKTYSTKVVTVARVGGRGY